MRSSLMPFLIIFLVIFLTACTNNKTAHSVNVIIMVQDTNENSLPRNHQVVKRLINQVSDELTSQGISVYDETAITLDDFNIKGAKTKAELIDFARSIHQVSLDYVVVLGIDALVKKTNYGQKISTSVYGQTIKVHSGNVMGNFNVAGAKLNANNECERYCLNNKLSDSLSAASGEVSAEISSDLAIINTSRTVTPKRKRSISISQDYALILNGFTAQNMTDIEDYLVMFSGYQGLHLSAVTHSFAEICYQSTIPEAKLNRNLKRMLKELNIRALINQEGNSVTINKITLRSKNNKNINKRESAFDVEGW